MLLKDYRLEIFNNECMPGAKTALDAYMGAFQTGDGSTPW